MEMNLKFSCFTMFCHRRNTTLKITKTSGYWYSTTLHEIFHLPVIKCLSQLPHVLHDMHSENYLWVIFHPLRPPQEIPDNFLNVSKALKSSQKQGMECVYQQFKTIIFTNELGLLVCVSFQLLLLISFLQTGLLIQSNITIQVSEVIYFICTTSVSVFL